MTKLSPVSDVNIHRFSLPVSMHILPKTYNYFEKKISSSYIHYVTCYGPIYCMIRLDFFWISFLEGGGGYLRTASLYKSMVQENCVYSVLT